MPLAHRIIPTILCRGRQLVKGRGFDSWRTVGLAMQAMRIHGERQVDELMVLDITATKEARGPNLELVSELVGNGFFSPLAVGGGVRSVQDVRDLLNAGADSVVIGSAALETDIVGEAAAIVGCQAITVSIDAKVAPTWSNQRWQVYGRCGTVGYHSSPSQPLSPAGWAREVFDKGAGQILLQSIERDGTGQGYDLDLIRAVRDVVPCPLVASGGAGNYEHMRQAIEAGASAVASGAMFQFEDATPLGAARYLRAAGIEVRIPGEGRC